MKATRAIASPVRLPSRCLRAASTPRATLSERRVAHRGGPHVVVREAALAQPIRLNEPLLWIWKTPNEAGVCISPLAAYETGKPRIELFSFVFAICLRTSARVALPSAQALVTAPTTTWAATYEG